MTQTAQQTFAEMTRKLPFDPKDIKTLQKAARDLDKWNELCCNYPVEEDEANPEYAIINNTDLNQKQKVKNLDHFATHKLKSIITKYPEWGFYIQRDPRGLPLYIFKTKDLDDIHAEADQDLPKSATMSANYREIGIPIYL